MEQVLLRNVEALWPHIYTPHSAVEQARAKHSVSFLATDEVDAIVNASGVYARESQGKRYYCATSIQPPRITSRKGDYGVLLQAIQIADARNIPRERLFAGMAIDLLVMPFEYETPVKSGVALGFSGIIINSADPLLVRALDHTGIE